MKNVVALFVVPFALVACGGYANVAPGMTAAEVNKQMSMFPVSRIEPFDGGYSATYYANDTCILFKDEKVVGKDEAQEQRQAIALGNIGMGAVTTCHAQCMPPGMFRQKVCDSSASVVRR